MAIAVDIAQAKRCLSRLMDQAHAGQEFILTKDGKPYARLLPLNSAGVQRRPGSLAGTVDATFFDPLPRHEIDAWDRR